MATKMATLTCLRKYFQIFFIILFVAPFSHSNLPEQGKFDLQFNPKNEYQYVRRTLYGNTSIELHINCTADVEIELGWLIRGTGCYEEYNSLNKTMASLYYKYPRVQFYMKDFDYNTSVQLSCTKETLKYSCNEHTFSEPECKADFSKVWMEMPESIEPPGKKTTGKETPDKKTGKKTPDKKTGKKTPAPSPPVRPPAKTQAPVPKTKAPPPKTSPTTAAPTRAPTKAPTTKSSTTKAPTTKTSSTTKAPTPKTPHTAQHLRKRAAVPKKSTTTTTTTVKPAPKPERDGAAKTFHLPESDGGVYVVVVRVYTYEKTNVTMSLEFHHHSYGYISPIDYPLLVVYGLLCAIYIIYAILWLVLLALNWKDILRLQYWIAGVIALGLLEKAILVSEYDSVYKTGHSVRGAAIFGSIVSCFKRSLARMLIIIASVGFGIVKPRLGPVLNKVLAAGGIYFVVACIAAWYNTTIPRIDTSKTHLYPEAVLIILDAFICWWIFSNLITTLRTLRLRRNIVKHSVYRHFTHTLIVAVLASIGYIIWSILVHRRQMCIKDYSSYWLDEAFWPMLFCAILLVIIILWRPTTNNQRYAFSPLLDRAEDDDETDDDDEIVLTDAYEGVKMRGTKEKAPRKDIQTKAEEDLKWVEDNIPASIADKALGIDSDEEIKQTRFEMGKMD